jgi:siderophore synthetase component/2-keto-3-deoxy-L-rhamnonate aldolase RhmA
VLKPNLLKQKLNREQPAYGLFCSIPSPVAVELIGEADFDFVIIDTEHVLVNPETLENMIRAAEAVGLTPLVRVPDINPKEILRALDGGAQGIVVPRVENADEMRRIVAACKYHPEGTRSLNGGRPGSFGKHSLADYTVKANREVMVVPMIETQAGVENISEILSVPGIDLVLEGAADLSQSLGLPWRIADEPVQQALRRIQQACARAGIPYCAIPRADGDYQAWRARGVRTFVLGDERGIAFRALQAKRNAIISLKEDHVTTDEPYQRQASERVLQDLVDCLFAEHFFDGAEQELIPVEQSSPAFEGLPGLSDRIRFPELPPDSLIWRWWISKTAPFFVLVPVARGIVQAFRRIPDTPAYAVESEGGGFRVHRLDAVSFMELVIANPPDSLFGNNKEGSALFLEWLRDAVQQTAWSMAHELDTGDLLTRRPEDLFRVLEQCSSLKDRPFHPVAKVKKGFVKQDYLKYMAEFGQDIQLNWVAVDRKYLDCGSGVTDPQQCQPAQFLLTSERQAALKQEMQERGIHRSHIALPVHPWQLRHVLPEQLAAELRNGVCVPLDFRQGGFLPTSSVRTLAPETDSRHHLKLPLGIHSLGASRYLPAVKMINGQRSESLLNQALALDGVLAQRMFVCDETRWWAYMPENGSLFDEAPRHLSVLVRSYPAKLTEDPSYRLIPMAALGTLLPGRDRHFFDEWLDYRRLPSNPVSVQTLFKELCLTFIDINLRMFRIGMLAEVHGQNAVLVWRDGKAFGLLLRDHDSLRVHVPWLVRNGLADPEYRLKPGHANTLYHETPDDLLFYLQTLAIQVNLRAVIEALALRYGIAEAHLWSALREVMEHIIDRLEFSGDVRERLRQALFHEPEWPLKLLVRPMIERAGGPGSMPFGKSRTQNPFRQLGEPADTVQDRGERRQDACIVPG